MSRRRRTTEEDDLEEIRKGFEMFDVNGTGVINPEELLEVMDSMNLKEKNPFIYEIIEALCSEKEFKKKGGVQLDELVNYVYNKVNDTETNVGIRQIYDVINDRETDTVQMSTFYTLARDYGDQLPEDEIRELLEKTQMGGEELNFDEFYTIMKNSKRSGDRSVNNSMNNSIRSSNAKKNNDVYVKKGSNNPSINSGEYSRKVRTKKYVSEYPQEKELPRDNEPYDEKGVIEETVTTTKNLRYNQNNFEDNVPPEQEDSQDQQSNYSYRKVIMGSAPKYEKVIEKHVNVEEGVGDFDENLKIDNIGNDDGNYVKERQTKITHLPDGGKEIEITEKTQIEVERPPSIRGSRYRYSKNSKNTNEEENNEDVKSQTRGTYYKVRRPRGNDNSNNNEEKRISISKVEVEESNDVIIPKRYHRRYRDNKVSTNNDN